MEIFNKALGAWFLQMCIKIRKKLDTDPVWQAFIVNFKAQFLTAISRQKPKGAIANSKHGLALFFGAENLWLHRLRFFTGIEKTIYGYKDK